MLADQQGNYRNLGVVNLERRRVVNLHRREVVNLERRTLDI